MCDCVVKFHMDRLFEWRVLCEKKTLERNHKIGAVKRVSLNRNNILMLKTVNITVVEARSKEQNRINHFSTWVRFGVEGESESWLIEF